MLYDVQKCAKRGVCIWDITGGIYFSTKRQKYKKILDTYIHELEKNLKFLKMISVLICNARHHQGLIILRQRKKLS